MAEGVGVPMARMLDVPSAARLRRLADREPIDRRLRKILSFATRDEKHPVDGLNGGAPHDSA